MLQEHLYIKKKYSIVALIILSTTLIGCVPVPEEVKNRMEDYGQNRQMGDSENQYCKIHEIDGKEFSKLSYEPENIKFNGNDKLEDIDSLYILHMKFKEDYEKINAETVTNLLYPDHNEVLEEWTDGIQNRNLTFDSKKQKVYINICSNGSINYISGNLYDEFYQSKDGYQIEKINETLIDATDEERQKKINLSGTEMNLNGLAEKAESSIKDILPDYVFSTQADDFYLYKDSYGDCIKVNMSLLYEGVPMDSYVNHFNGQQFYCDLICLQNSMDFHSADQFDCLNIVGQLDIDSRDVLTEVISPESALEIVDKTFSGFEPIEVEQVKIYYALLPKEDSKFRFPGMSGQIVSGRPVYAFLIKKKNVEIASDSIPLKSNLYDYIYVDMQDGRVMTNIGEQ